MNRLARLVVRKPGTIIAITLLFTLSSALILGFKGIRFDGSPETLARAGSLEFFNEIRSSFGDDRVVIVALTTDSVFEPAFLRRLDLLTRELALIQGVSETQSLTNIKTIRSFERGIAVEPLIDHAVSDSAEDLKQLQTTVTRDPLYIGHFVSEDGRSAAINVFLKPLNQEQRLAAASEIERVAHANKEDDELMISGVPIIEAHGIRSMVTDMLLLSPLATLFCFLVFLFSFRTLTGAVLPTIALLLGLLCTVAIMSLSGKPVTLTTLSLPTVLMAVGSSYIFHVLNQFRISMASLPVDADRAARQSAWYEGIRFISPSVLLSGTATMAGFGALASSPVPTVRDMGIYDAAGVFILLLLTLGFVPAALALLPRTALGRVDRDKDYAGWLNGLLKSTAAVVIHRTRTALLITLALTLLVGFGVVWLRANTDYLRLFPETSNIVVSAEKLHQRLAGPATIQFIVSGAPGSITNPEALNSISSLEEFASQQTGVDATLSISAIVKRLNGALNKSPTIPDDPRQVESLFDDFLTQDNAIYHLINRDFSRANIVLRTNLFASEQLNTLTTRLDDWCRSNLPAGLTAQATGSIVLLNDASDAVAESQVSSLVLALVAIYLMMVVLFRSFATGLLALIPNLIPIIGFFGFLGWSDIPLDITTSLVASAALGLAVDNAVHMIRRYRQAVDEKGSEPAGLNWAVWLMLLRTGKPMILANVMLIGGFLIFTFSSFVPVKLGGILWSVTIAACLAANLFVLPVLMRSRLFAQAAIGTKSKGQQAKPPVTSPTPEHVAAQDGFGGGISE